MLNEGALIDECEPALEDLGVPRAPDDRLCDPSPGGFAAADPTTSDVTSMKTRQYNAARRATRVH